MSLFIAPGESINGFFIRKELFHCGAQLGNLIRKYVVPGNRKLRLINDEFLGADHEHLNYFAEEKMSHILVSNSIIPIFVPTSKPYLPVAFKSQYASGLSEMPSIGSYRNYLNYKDHLFSDIKYCPICFEEQMVEHGFTWFRVEWQFFHANVCLKHKVPLNEIYCKNCGVEKSLNRAIKSVLTGRCIACQNILWGENERDLLKKEPSIVQKWFFDLFNSNIPHLSPKLRKYLLLDAYIRSGGSASDDKYKIVNKLWDLVKKMIPKDITVSKRMSLYGLYHILDEYNDGFSPLLFWLPLASVFLSFDIFKDYLQTITKRFNFDYTNKYLPYVHSNIGQCSGLCLIDENPTKLIENYMDRDDNIHSQWSRRRVAMEEKQKQARKIQTLE